MKKVTQYLEFAKKAQGDAWSFKVSSFEHVVREETGIDVSRSKLWKMRESLLEAGLIEKAEFKGYYKLVKRRNTHKIKKSRSK